MIPIFISGIGRSGTSALLKALTCHRDVYTPDAIGEAPFVQKILQFLMEYEETSDNAEYHLANYKVADVDKNKAFAELMFLVQNGRDVSECGEKFWVAKLTPTLKEFEKSQQIFGNLRNVGIVRNGIEVVNSAKSFKGFANLTFEQLCQRWATNLSVTEYLGKTPLTCIVRHIDLVSDTKEAFTDIFERLEMDYDENPVEFISRNIFNSSFDSGSNDAQDLRSIFENRSDCWYEWSAEEKEIFIELCDSRMEEFDFRRPYVKQSTESSSKIVDINEARTGSQGISKVVTEGNENPVKSTSSKKRDLYLSETVRARLCKNDKDYLIDYHCNVSDKYKYVFWENPKVGSTTLLAFLQSQECQETASSMKNSHQRKESPLNRISEYKTIVQDQILFGEEYFKCAFVRNPYTRLLSAYKSKIEKNLPAKYEVLSVLHAEKEVENLDLSEKVSFDQFVDVVCSQSIVDMNSHWKLQKYQIHADVISYDFIGKLENSGKDFSWLFKKIFGANVSELPISKNATDANRITNDYYSSGLSKKVFDKFEEDFTLFEYDSNLICDAA